MRMLRVFGERRTWGALGYALVGFPLAVFGFCFVVVSLSLSAGLAITLVGVPLLGVSVAVARVFGRIYRSLGRHWLAVDVNAPLVRRRPGLLGFVSERNGWRAMLFLLIRFPLAVVEFSLTASLVSYGLAAITYPAWWHAMHQRVDGHTRYGMRFGPHEFADHAGWIALVCLVGVVLLLAWPWIVRGMTRIDAALIRGLLGPTEADRRIRALEETRTMAVDDSAAELRRIERDLHDGAQARLVSLAMNLGLAKEELASAESGSELAKVRDLVDSAHREAKGTITELRDLARGIHPPALDRGLPDALSTLTSRCAIPTTLHIDLPERPSPAVETITYFCTAELLTNAVKHSGAHHASVDVRAVDHRVFLRVSDDGAGGARIGGGGGSGLAGLGDRLATVDGQLTIDSPAGGPSLITIEIPV